MSTQTSPAVKLMVQSGMVPENTLRQLIHWRLVPGTLGSEVPDEPVIEKEWESVESFLAELKDAISQEMADIRYTDFNRSGVFHRVTVAFNDGSCAEIDALVDKIGRVIVPGTKENERIEHVAFGPSSEMKPVLRTEARYEGERVGAWVMYLEEEDDGSVESH